MHMNAYGKKLHHFWEKTTPHPCGGMSSLVECTCAVECTRVEFCITPHPSDDLLVVSKWKKKPPAQKKLTHPHRLLR